MIEPAPGSLDGYASCRLITGLLALRPMAFAGTIPLPPVTRG